MNSTNFTKIAARYEKHSIIQKSASEKLMGLIDIKTTDDVLDLGCGTGNLTRKLRTITDGCIVGVDPSTGMIREAEKKQAGHRITFSVGSAEGLAYRDSFTVVFCNSAFMWFPDPEKALKNCLQALRKNGRMGIQAPAKKNYCPNFLEAIDAVAQDPRTAEIFSGFRSPWLFLDTADEYASLFKKAGFAVTFATIEEQKSFHAAEEVMTIFESGAAAGYLNQEFYAAPFNEDYTKSFREIVKESFYRQANERGLVEVTFNRVYLLAIKETEDGS